jgi:hypothetical protein
MQENNISAKQLKTRLFGFGASFLVLVALLSVWSVIHFNPSKTADAAAMPKKNTVQCVSSPFNLVVGNVDLKVKKDNTIEASMHLFYVATANANIPMVFHIHLNTATGPVAYTGSASTDAHGWIIANHILMTATEHAPKGPVVFPTNGTWILNFHDTTLSHKAGTPPVAIGHAPIVDIKSGGTTAVVTGFLQ